ncbi:hypothetical protein PO124_16690 [Bacillus licheniformis]|nr:hypothetical protein [Bacillus licheniformis]
MVGIQKRRFQGKHSPYSANLSDDTQFTHAKHPDICRRTNEHPLISLSILGTTDIHAHMMDYDYYADKETAEFGLARTAQLIESTGAGILTRFLSTTAT